MENVSRTPWCRTRALSINIYIYIYIFCFCHALIKWISKVWMQSRGGLNFFPKNSWTATPLFLPYDNPPLISLWLDLSCDHFSVELPISFSTSWSRKISHQVHLNQSETEKYFERKDIYVKSYTTHVKTHSSWTLSVVLVCCPILFSSTGHKSISSVPARVCHCMNSTKDREMTPTKSIQGPLWPFPSLIMSLLLQLQ